MAGGNFPTMHESGVRFGLLAEGNCKEQFSIAYAHSVVTAARCKLENIRVDDESVDATIRQESRHEIYDFVSLDVQLKCTSQDIEGKTGLSWKLKAKNYNDLSSLRRTQPAILVVLRVPERFEDWCAQETDVMHLTRSAYWASIRGESPIPDKTSKVVPISKENVFNVEQLLKILKLIGDGGRAMSSFFDSSLEDADVRPGQLRAYLMSEGWTLVRVDADSASELWQTESSVRSREQVVLPTDPTFVDYSRRFADAVDRLRDVYHWDLIDFVQSVQAVRSDMLYVRADQVTRLDSIPLQQAEQLIQGSIQLLQSAAWSTISPRASLAGRRPTAVKEFIEDDVRMGHTKRGSFVLTILANIDDSSLEVVDESTETVEDVFDRSMSESPYVGPSDAGDGVRDDASGAESASATSSSVNLATRPAADVSEQRFVLPPFTRRVMSTLASGLQGAQALATSASVGAQIDAAVDQGVSAQLFQSLHKMTRFEGLRELDMSFQWAPLPTFDPPRVEQVEIGRDSIANLEVLAERFRARKQLEHQRLLLSVACSVSSGSKSMVGRRARDRNCSRYSGPQNATAGSDRAQVDCVTAGSSTSLGHETDDCCHR